MCDEAELHSLTLTASEPRINDHYEEQEVRVSQLSLLVSRNRN